MLIIAIVLDLSKKVLLPVFAFLTDLAYIRSEKDRFHRQKETKNINIILESLTGGQLWHR